MATRAKKLRTLDETAGVVASYRDIFGGDPIPVDELLGSADRASWAMAFAQLNRVLQAEDLLKGKAEAIIKSCFADHEWAAIHQDGRRKPVALEAFSVALATQLAITHSAEEGPVPTPDVMLALAARLSYLTFESLFPSGPVPKEILQGALSGMTSRRQIRPPAQVARRAVGLWVLDHSCQTVKGRAARAQFDGAVQRSFGVSLVDWVAAIVFSSWRSLAIDMKQPGGYLTAALAEHVPALTPEANALLVKVQTSLETTLESFAAEGRASLAEHWPVGKPQYIARPSLSPLMRYPLLKDPRMSPDWVILSSSHLAEAAITRPVVALEQILASGLDEEGRRKGVQQARGHFGDAVEPYLQHLLSIWLGPQYRPIDQSGLADGAALCGTTLFVVECKSSLRLLDTRYELRSDEDFRTELSRKIALPTAARQLQTTIELLLGDQSRLGSNARVTRVVPLIVTYDQYATSFLARDVWNSVLPTARRQGTVEVCATQVISANELEWIGDQQHWRPADYMVEKARDEDDRFDSVDVYLRAREMNHQSGLLAKKLRTNVYGATDKALIALLRPFFPV